MSGIHYPVNVYMILVFVCMFGDGNGVYLIKASVAVLFGWQPCHMLLNVSIYNRCASFCLRESFEGDDTFYNSQYR